MVLWRGHDPSKDSHQFCWLECWDQIRGLRMQVISFLNPTIILILQGIKWSAPSFEDETGYCTTCNVWSFTENSSCGQFGFMLLTMESPSIHWLSITSNRFCLHDVTEMSQFCTAELFRQHNSQPHIWKTTDCFGFLLENWMKQFISYQNSWFSVDLPID